MDRLKEHEDDFSTSPNVEVPKNPIQAALGRSSTEFIQEAGLPIELDGVLRAWIILRGQYPVRWSVQDFNDFNRRAGEIFALSRTNPIFLDPLCRVLDYITKQWMVQAARNGVQT